MNKINFLGLLIISCTLQAYTQEQMEEMIEAGQEAAVYEWLNRTNVKPVQPRPRVEKKDNVTKDTSSNNSQTTQPTIDTQSTFTSSVEELVVVSIEVIDSQSTFTDLELFSISIDSADLQSSFTDLDSLVSVAIDSNDSQTTFTHMDELIVIESDGMIEIVSESDEVVSEEVESTEQVESDNQTLDSEIISSQEEIASDSNSLDVTTAQPFGVYQALIDDYDIYVAEGSLQSLKKAVNILKELAKSFTEEAELIEADTDLYTALINNNLYPVSALKKQQKQLENQIKKMQVKPGIVGWITSWFGK